jgi:hypothetical protein
MTSAFLPLHCRYVLPCCGMVGLTSAVWLKLYFDRFSEMAARKISPDDLSRRDPVRLYNINASDNFKNLFEAPVLFYTLLGCLMITETYSVGFEKAAWLYVGFRSCHSLIHCTINNVSLRFTAYLASCCVLGYMWTTFALDVMNRLPSSP